MYVIRETKIDVDGQAGIRYTATIHKLPRHVKAAPRLRGSVNANASHQITRNPHTVPNACDRAKIAVDNEPNHVIVKCNMFPSNLPQ